MGDARSVVAGPGGLTIAGRALMAAGLAVVAVAMVVPFASNEAECLDHCADATSYYVWNPLHNPGAPFLLLGVVASLAAWSTPGRTGRIVTSGAAVSGALGLVLYFNYATAFISEFHLYGGPPLETSPSRALVVYGWVALQAGAALALAGRRD